MARTKGSGKRKTQGQQGDLLEALLKIRDDWRSRLGRTKNLVKGKALQSQWTRQGRIYWYLHPQIQDYSVRNLLIFLQEIPPGSRSGKQKHPGGLCHYILEGKGYTLVDDQKHDWEAGDVVVLPVKPNGITYQHFNGSPTDAVRFVAGMPNWFGALGVDLGSAWEQLEDAPEYVLQKGHST